MNDSSEQRFLERLRAALNALSPSPRFAVAFSGGLDSTVLLAATIRLPDVESVRALHVDHGVHPDSGRWAQRCRDRCREWNVPFREARIVVDARAGAGLEAAAREARYAALGELLEDGETLLTAHHADDQLETLLLRMLRGTGVRGLRGILPAARFGRGFIARPLLEIPRAELRAQAEQWGLDWQEDPSNENLDYDRNRLRAQLLPVIRERWGSAPLRSAARLASAMTDAEEILGWVAERDLAAAGAEHDIVPLAPLRELGAARQRNALRHAVRAAGLSVPNARQLEALRTAAAAARPDARTLVQWPGGEARVYRDRLYLCGAGVEGAGREGAARAPVSAARAPDHVSAGRAWSGPQGRLVLEPAASAAVQAEAAGDSASRNPATARVPHGMPESWAREGLEIRFRIGGERFRPAGDAHHRSLKHWFQQRGVVPWMRDRIPLLYRGGRLIAVADLVLADEAARAAPAEPRWRVRWLDHPRIA